MLIVVTSIAKGADMASITRASHTIAVVCLAILVSGCAAARTGDSSSTMNSSASLSPTASPSSSPAAKIRPLRDGGSEGVLAPGTYLLDTLPVDLMLDIPAGDSPGWHVGKATPGAVILLWFTPPEITYGLAIWKVDNVPADPCNAAGGELDPPVGPSVDDFVSALSDLPGFRATAPVDVAVGAFEGKEIALTALHSGDDCPQPIAWSVGNDMADFTPGDEIPLWILDVDGVRLVVFPIEPEEPDHDVRAELQQILDSIRTDP
jgi:hypothetical protein